MRPIPHETIRKVYEYVEQPQRLRNRSRRPGDYRVRAGAQAFAHKGIEEGGLLVQARGSTWGWLVFQELTKFD